MRDLGFYSTDGGALEEFCGLIDQQPDTSGLRYAAGVQQNVPLYDMNALRPMLSSPEDRCALMAEWGWVLGQSSGVLVLKAAYGDIAPVDRATAVFEEIIAREKAESGAKADHFANAGANDRIWNALQKLCLTDPKTFALYHGNPVIDAICEAWLGPFYQMTAQVNLVRPGGLAQSVHRDYHLGFQTAEVAVRFPAHVHGLSAAMTLQGAIAHCDMPVESGTTRLLPFSQLFGPGYLAYRRPEFADVFAQRAVQLPLSKGDALFFNPALFHAAGENRTADVQRMANLLQISSAFGRAMESVDRVALCSALYPAVQALRAAGRLDGAETEAVVAAAAEGYSFPTNLDTDPPVGGLAPETQAALFLRALSEGWAPPAFEDELAAQAARRAA